MNYITELITPAKAQEYLATSKGNRPISKPTVNNYADIMKKGGWLLNGQCLIFDTGGHLLDGHHRLNAVVKADVAVTFGVLRGIPTEAFATIDCGLKRTAGQVLAMSGVKNYNNVAAIVAAARILAENGRLMENNGHYSAGMYNNSDKYDYYKTDPDGFQEACNFANIMVHKSRIMAGSWVGSIYYYLTRHGNYGREEVLPFFDTLFSLDSSAVPVAALLRKNILKETLAGKRLSAELRWAWTAKAWNYYIDGRSPKFLVYYPTKEELPRLRIRIAPLKKDDDGQQQPAADEAPSDEGHADSAPPAKVETPLEAWAKRTMGSTDTLTTTQVAKGMGMTAKVLNQRLKDAGVQFFQSGQWMLRAPYSAWNLSEARTSTYTRPNGTTGTNTYTVWNERGRFFLDALHKNDFNVERTMAYIRQ